MSKIYGIYEDTRVEQCIFVGTVKEIAEFLNTTENVVYCMVSKKNKVKYKFKIKSLYRE